MRNSLMATTTRTPNFFKNSFFSEVIVLSFNIVYINPFAAVIADYSSQSQIIKNIYIKEFINFFIELLDEVPY